MNICVSELSKNKPQENDKRAQNYLLMEKQLEKPSTISQLFDVGFYGLIFNVREHLINQDQHSKYYGCWCRRSLCHEVINSQNIEYVE